MSTYIGATVEIHRQTKDLAKTTKEYIGTLDGSAGTQTLYTKNFPIVTSAGATTDDETEVDVFTDDGTPVGSWTEYLDDGSDFTITGATGTVVIAAAENQGGNSGERISISYRFTAEVGMGQTVAIDDKRDLKEVFKLGSAALQEIKAGKRPAVVLEFDSFYVNRVEFGALLSQQDYTKKLQEYDFFLYPNNKTSGQPRITVSDIQCEFQRLETDIDSITLVKAKFKGISVAIDTVP